jgi:hypothetical protein
MTQGRFNASVLSLARARHRGAATLAALALLLVGGGCGGGGKSGSSEGAQLSKLQYEARIQKDGADIKQAFEPLSRPPSSLDQFARQIEAGQKKLREAADDLDSIRPPTDVRHDNDVLVAGLRKLADKLEPLRKGAKKNDVALVRKAVSDLQKSQSLKAAQKATADMKKKGYKIGTLGQ